MEIYDIIMLVVLVGTTLFGAWKGVAWQLASLTSLVASYFVALRFSETLAPYFGAQAPLNRFGAMLALYAVTSLVIWLAFRVVSGWLNRLRLRDFDRQLGALFGAAKGVLFCIGITFFAVTLSQPARDTILRSRSGYYIAIFLNQADSVMPKELHEVLNPYLDRLERELEPAGGPTHHTATSRPRWR
jgi:membrane protein required for colicin V production